MTFMQASRLFQKFSVCIYIYIFKYHQVSSFSFRITCSTFVGDGISVMSLGSCSAASPGGWSAELYSRLEVQLVWSPETSASTREVSSKTAMLYTYVRNDIYIYYKLYVIVSIICRYSDVVRLFHYTYMSRYHTWHKLQQPFLWGGNSKGCRCGWRCQLLD